jgi:hypothetical protein
MTPCISISSISIIKSRLLRLVRSAFLSRTPHPSQACIGSIKSGVLQILSSSPATSARDSWQWPALLIRPFDRPIEIASVLCIPHTIQSTRSKLGIFQHSTSTSAKTQFPSNEYGIFAGLLLYGNCFVEPSTRLTVSPALPSMCLKPLYAKTCYR